MLKQEIKIGMTVKTKDHGIGKVIKKEISSDEHRTESGRFGIELNNPSLWPCHQPGTLCYYTPRELTLVD